MDLGVPTTSNIGMLLASFSRSAPAEGSRIGGLAQTGMCWFQAEAASRGFRARRVETLGRRGDVGARAFIPSFGSTGVLEQNLTLPTR